MEEKKNIVRFYLEIDQESKSVEVTDLLNGTKRKFDSVLLICGDSLEEKLFSAMYGHSQDVARGLAGFYKYGRESNSKPIKDTFLIFIKWVAQHLGIQEDSIRIDDTDEIEAILNRWEKEKEDDKKNWN